jgi:hypothetical protein
MEQVEALAAAELDGRPSRRALPEVVVDPRAQVIRWRSAKPAISLARCQPGMASPGK